MHSEDEQELRVASERQAYLEMHSTLLEQYPAQYIAIHKGKLIDHDLDKLALYTRIEEAYPHEFVFMRRVEAAPEREIVFHSLRFVENI